MVRGRRELRSVIIVPSDFKKENSELELIKKIISISPMLYIIGVIIICSKLAVIDYQLLQLVDLSNILILGLPSFMNLVLSFIFGYSFTFFNKSLDWSYKKIVDIKTIMNYVLALIAQLIIWAIFLVVIAFLFGLSNAITKEMWSFVIWSIGFMLIFFTYDVFYEKLKNQMIKKIVLIILVTCLSFEIIFTSKIFISKKNYCKISFTNDNEEILQSKLLINNNDFFGLYDFDAKTVKIVKKADIKIIECKNDNK